MTKLLKVLYSFYAYCVFAAVFLLFLPILLVANWHRRSYSFALRVRRLGVKLVLMLIGIRLHIKGKCQAPPSVLCANHASFLDILVILACCPGCVRFLAKASLQKIPLFGLFFNSLDIPVDRSSVRNSALAYKRAETALASGHSVVFFPEGGIREGSPKLQAFKTGAFRLATTHQRLQAITLLGTWRCMPDGSALLKPGKITVHFHPCPTFDTSNQWTVSSLSSFIFDQINKPLETYLHESDRRTG